MIQILILDDSQDKRDLLKSVISPLFPKGEILIEEADCLVDGREMLQLKAYDMLILDMILPEHREDHMSEMNRRGGVELLEEIYINHSIKKPVQIIGLTEYEEEFSEQQKEFKDKLWYLLFYSRKNQEWKVQLKDKVCQLVQMKKDIEASINNFNKYDFGIICALNEEFTMLQKAFMGCKWDTMQFEGLPYVFNTTKITSSHMKEYSILAACANKPGICATSVLASSMYNRFNVDTIFMTGITAGVNNGDIILDDIIIADAIHDYASGKIKEQPSGDIEFLKEMNQIPASRNLIALVSEFISNPEHIRKINDAIHDANLKDEKENLSAHIAKTVCGPFVVASSTFIEDLQKDERKLQALDMEGFALYATAHTLDKKALWIKSVSDFADIKKSDGHHKTCCFASGVFLYEFIREML